MCGKRIDILYTNGKIELKYLKAGVPTVVVGLPNRTIKNADFELKIETPDVSEFKEAATTNKLYFHVNRSLDLLNQLKKM